MATAEERIASLEQRLARMERDLAHAQQAARGSGRVWQAVRLVTVCVMAGIIGGLTMGTTSAAPQPKSLSVTAPFEVKNDAGKVVFRIGTNNDAGVARLFDASGNVLVALQPALNSAGGEIAVRGDKDGQVARLGDNPHKPDEMSLRFYQGAALLAGVGASKNIGIVQVNSATGQKMALLSSNDTTGTLAIYDKTGGTKALLGSDTATGDAEFDLLYKAGFAPAVQLSEVARGGYVAVTNRAGIARVELGTLASDQGIVRAYGPGGFDYIRGLK